MNSNFEEFAEIAINEMGRILFVNAYADHVDDPESNCPAHHCKNGEDWKDFAPKTPEGAFKAGREVAKLFEKLNGKPFAKLLEEAAFADDGCSYSEEDDAIKYAQEFGSDLAMQAIGSGVSWFDDHASFPLKCPLVSVRVYQCEGCGEYLDFE